MTELPVEIVRSARRKSTLQATIIAGTIRVRVPAGLPPAEERRMVDELVAKVRKKARAGAVDLWARATALARRFDLPEPEAITWSSRQNTRWGSCTSTDGTIRISDRLASVPPFVLDYVIVHELAHLVVNGHGREFDALVARYELAERARGYLMALNQSGPD
ncbi:MAG: M48 family metallopeptidase [Acidimicrobiia bacterium]